MAIPARSAGLRLVTSDGETELDGEILQGLWTEEIYLRMTNPSNRLMEFTDGVIDLLPVLNRGHQKIVRSLITAFEDWVLPMGGIVMFTGFRLRLRAGKFREPDILLLLDEQDPRNGAEYWLGADLVVEVVSPDDPDRDLVEKRLDYAEAGIAEYWIIEPVSERVTVLRLDETGYVVHGVFRRGDVASSARLAGFGVAVGDILDED